MRRSRRGRNIVERRVSEFRGSSIRKSACTTFVVTFRNVAIAAALFSAHVVQDQVRTSVRAQLRSIPLSRSLSRRAVIVVVIVLGVSWRAATVMGGTESFFRPLID